MILLVCSPVTQTRDDVSATLRRTPRAGFTESQLNILHSAGRVRTAHNGLFTERWMLRGDEEGRKWHVNVQQDVQSSLQLEVSAALIWVGRSPTQSETLILDIKYVFTFPWNGNYFMFSFALYICPWKTHTHTHTGSNVGIAFNTNRSEERRVGKEC